MTESVVVSLRRAREFLEAGRSDSPQLDAEVLLGHVLERSRAWLLSHPQDVLAEDDSAKFFSLIARRATGVPVAYLTGKREFWSLTLRVTQDVLIPRPETELLVEKGLDFMAGKSGQVLDLGCGSGAISLAIASERPDVSVTGVDKSPAAIRIARENAGRLGVANVGFLESDWFDSVSEQRFDLIVANPPYVDANDPHLAGEVRFEPRDALVAHDQGLADLEKIISTAPRFQGAGAALMVEHGFEQHRSVALLFNRSGYEEIITCHDLAGLPRVTLGIKPMSGV